MQNMDREKLLHRLELRKQQSLHHSPHIPGPPSPSLYYHHVANQLNEDDPLFLQLRDHSKNDEILTNWRCGSLNIPRNIPMRLIRMPEKHQYALLRSIGGDGTACGKLWAPALVFPLILADETTIIYKKLYQWISKQNILEIGAGWAGTPSLTAYRLGAAQVMITDGEDVMIQCAQVNIAAELSSYNIAPSGKLSAHVLRWGNPSDAAAILSAAGIPSIDCIIGCDCIYDTATVANLFNSIASDLNCDHVIFCWETRDHRYDAEETFFQQLLCQYSFRMKYFTSSLLSDLSYHTVSSEIQTACDEIRSYLDSYQSGASLSSSFSAGGGGGTADFAREQSYERNDINLLFAERWVPVSQDSPFNSPVGAKEREKMKERVLSQALAEEKSSKSEAWQRKESKKGCDGDDDQEEQEEGSAASDHAAAARRK
jgi:hypothetical protein